MCLYIHANFHGSNYFDGKLARRRVTSRPKPSCHFDACLREGRSYGWPPNFSTFHLDPSFVIIHPPSPITSRKLVSRVPSKCIMRSDTCRCVWCFGCPEKWRGEAVFLVASLQSQPKRRVPNTKNAHQTSIFASQVPVLLGLGEAGERYESGRPLGGCRWIGCWRVLRFCFG